MDKLDPQTLNTLAIVAILVVLAIAVWFFYQRRQSERLSDQFGPEYKRTVEELGSKPKAEAELLARQKRVEKFNIIPLAPAEAERFAAAWRTLQGRFVDNPKGALMEADALVRDLMQKRGYPMADFERRAADISVDHPHVVDHYRTAQAIAFLDRRGEADTEALRKAVVHYRALFDELLEVRSPQRETIRQMEAHS